MTRNDGSVSELRFKKSDIATGERAAAPPIPGLKRVNYLTNETLFSLTELPGRFGIVGAGPIGAEMAQAFASFGNEVFLFEPSDHILSREDADAAIILQEQFIRDGINFVLGSEDQSISLADNGQIRVTGKHKGQPYNIVVDQLLVELKHGATSTRTEAANVVPNVCETMFSK